MYAFRTGTREHVAAMRWLRHLAEGQRPWALPALCITEFVRVTTHARILQPPAAVAEALAALDALLASPTLKVISAGPRFPELLARHVVEGDGRGNLALDAHIAAVCEEHAARWLLTQDRDFARFPDVRTLSLADDPDLV